MTSKSVFKKIALTAARAGDSKKARPVVVYDLAGSSPLADYAALIQVESSPQLEAVEEEIVAKLKREGIFCLHRDGMRSRNWRVLDYGGALVHIYDATTAEFYSMDKIYGACRQVPWEDISAVRKASPAKKKRTAAAKASGTKAAVRPASSVKTRRNTKKK